MCATSTMPDPHALLGQASLCISSVTLTVPELVPGGTANNPGAIAMENRGARAIQKYILTRTSRIHRRTEQPNPCDDIAGGLKIRTQYLVNSLQWTVAGCKCPV